MTLEARMTKEEIGAEVSDFWLRQSLLP